MCIRDRDYTNIQNSSDVNNLPSSDIKVDANTKADLNFDASVVNPSSSSRLRARPGVGRSGKPASAG
eukprot:3477339-Alexandrium_andersonii.AAC.1